MKKLLVATMLIASLGLSGCAFVMTGKTEKVTLESTPSEAAFKITNRAGTVVEEGVTPSKLALKKGRGYFKGEEYTLEIQKEGYKTERVIIDSAPNGWYLFGNFFIGGLLGYIVVDPLTGAMFKLDPNKINAQLKPEGDAPTDTAPALTPAM